MNQEWIKKLEREVLNIVHQDCLIVFQDSGNLKAFKKKLKTFLFNECYDFDTKTITDRYCIWVKKKKKKKSKWNGLQEHYKVAIGPKTSTTRYKIQDTSIL